MVLFIIKAEWRVLPLPAGGPLHSIYKSGWRDSNSRPPAPKAGALAGLRYTPIFTLSLTLDSVLIKLKDEDQLRINKHVSF